MSLKVGWMCVVLVAVFLMNWRASNAEGVAQPRPVESLASNQQTFPRAGGADEVTRSAATASQRDRDPVANGSVQDFREATMTTKQGAFREPKAGPKSKDF